MWLILEFPGKAKDFSTTFADFLEALFLETAGAFSALPTAFGADGFFAGAAFLTAFLEAGVAAGDFLGFVAMSSLDRKKGGDM
jgi:hypothetical protein